MTDFPALSLVPTTVSQASCRTVLPLFEGFLGRGRGLVAADEGMGQAARRVACLGVACPRLGMGMAGERIVIDEGAGVEVVVGQGEGGCVGG